MTKREDKKAKKVRKALELFEVQYSARTTYLLAQELEFDRRVRNKALRLAKKRKLGDYIQ